MLTRATPRTARTSFLLLLFVAAAGFAAGAATLYYVVLPRWQAETGERPAGVPPAAQVVALGRIQPAQGIRTVSGPPGDQIARIYDGVVEGATVAQGQPLAELASRPDRDLEVTLLRQQIASAKDQQAIALKNAERGLALAQAKIEELNTVVPKEIEAQGYRLAALREKLAAATEDFRRMTEVRSGTVPEQEIRASRVALAQLSAEVQAGEVSLSKAGEERKNALKVAELQKSAAEADYERARNDKAVESLETKLTLATRQLERTTLTAPCAGTVLKVSGAAGDPTAPQQPILQLADLRHMVVVAEVYETDVERLRQAGTVTAKVRSRALPKELSGTVTRIGRLIARNTAFDIDPTADADRRVFEVRVALAGDSAAVAGQFLNLQVQVFFETAK